MLFKEEKKALTGLTRRADQQTWPRGLLEERALDVESSSCVPFLPLPPPGPKTLSKLFQVSWFLLSSKGLEYNSALLIGLL